MRIALLTDGITPFVTGGMQRHSFHLARQFLKNGVKLTLVHTVPYATEPIANEEVEKALGAHSENLEVIYIPFEKSDRFPGHYIRESYAYSQAVFQALENRWAQFDFIYAKGFTAWSLLEKKKRGLHTAPVGVKFHGYEMFQKTRNFKGKLEQYMLKPPVVFNNRQADLVFSYGGEISSIIEKLGVQKDKIVEIGSGIDREFVKDQPNPTKERRKFIFVGRDERRKGIRELVGALKGLDADFEIHWVGPILPENQWKDTRSIYHGEVKSREKICELLDNADVLVAPSHAEGMPNVILEAMGRGLAVLSTDVGAVSMMVCEGNGRLISPGNIKDLRTNLEHLINLPSNQLESKKRKSIEKVKRQFLWSEVGQNTLEKIRRYTFAGERDGIKRNG